MVCVWNGGDVPVAECAHPVVIGQWMGLEFIIVVVGVLVTGFVDPA